MVIDHIKTNLSTMCRAIKKRGSLIRAKVYLEIKHFSELRRINKYKAEQILMKLTNCLKTVLRFRKKKETMLLLKTFIKWKDTAVLKSKLHKLRSELEQSLEKKLEKEIAGLDNRIKEKDRENNELRRSITKHGELENELSKKMRAYEEKESNFLQAIKKIEVYNVIYFYRKRRK